MSACKTMTVERASAIVNDIHEGMCRASRNELMECASFYAVENSKLFSEASSAYTACLGEALKNYQEFHAHYRASNKKKAP